MNQFVLLIHGNPKSHIDPSEWDRFFTAATESGMFRGGSELGERLLIGDKEVPSSEHLSGFMRFDTKDREKLLELLEIHPILVHGGTLELCEMPLS